MNSLTRFAPIAIGALVFACGNATPVATHAPVAPPSSTTPVPPSASVALTASAPVASASASAPAPVASAPAPSPPVKRPMNVMLIVIDAMRADMPWNGYPRAIAPNLTQLYQQSVRYPHAYSVSSFTSKSVPVMLSGHYPSELHRTTEFFSQYAPRNQMMAEVLKDAGVHTLAGHAHMYLDKPSGLTQGFEVWKLVPGITFDYNKDPYITSQKLTPLAISILSEAKNTSPRFFAYFHYMDPHDEYQSHPESPKFGGKARDRYDEEVFYTDLWVQKLLDFVQKQPWAQDTAIIITADHGEAFGEHKIWRHAFELYDNLVHVPFFVLIPGVAPREVPTWRGQIDLAPTIYDLLGVAAPADLPGKSLLPEIMGPDQPARPILCDLPADSHNEKRRAMIEDGWKLISFANDFRFEMYNLLDDPGETKDLYKRDKAKAASMRARFKEVKATIHEVKAQGGPPVKD